MENMNKRKKSEGFTLMELMIVMVIMSILASLVIGNFSTSTKRGRDTRRKTDLGNIQTALESYFNDKGVYPTGVTGVMTGCGVGDSMPCNWGSAFIDKYSTLYMNILPADPVSGKKYYYVSAGSSYKIYAKLENTLDTGTGVKQAGYAGTNCATSGTTLCTFGVASSNTTP